MKKVVKFATQCNDSLIQIAGRQFLGVPTQRCELHVGNQVEMIEGPITVSDHSGKKSEIVKVRHFNESRQIHEGWVIQSALE